MGIKRRRYGRSGWGYTLDDEKVPGVTKILAMLPNENLIDWAARVTAEYALDHWAELGRMAPSARLNTMRGSRWEVTSAARVQGTDVHRIGQGLIAGETVTVPDELAAYVEPYRAWLDDVEPVPVATELLVASRAHRYCGLLDLITDLPAVITDDGLIPAGRWLIDLKTSAKPKGPYPEVALQACAYKRAEVFAVPDAEGGYEERPMDWLQIEHCGVLSITPDSCELRLLDTGPEVWEMFLHLRWLQDHQEAMKSWIGGPVAIAELVA